jgi:hypothetical protein
MRHEFVSEVQHHKGAYVSVEEPTKVGLLSNLNPPRTTTKVKFVSSLSILMKRSAI